MIVKDLEDGLSNFPEDVDIYFEYNGKQLHIASISWVDVLIDPPTQAIVARFTDGTVQGQE